MFGATSLYRLPVQILAQVDEDTVTTGPVEIFEGLAITVIVLVIMSFVSKAVTTREDRDWLPTMLMLAAAAKLIGGFGRYWMVTVLYQTGDSFSYHLWGSVFAQVWRGFAVPVSNSSQPGTAFAEVVTGFIYAPYTPSMLGGFLIFSTLAFIGLMLFFFAGRLWLKGYQLKMYGIAVFFAPSLIFWPSSIGKDALMVFFLGIAAYGASRLLKFYQFSSLLLIAPGLYLASSIRAHIAAVMGLAIVLAAFLGKAPKKYRGSAKRAIMILACAGGAALSVMTFSTTFGVSVDGGEGTTTPDQFLSDVSDQTATGGSEVEGGAVGSPAQLPGAIIKVLFRPLIYEAGNAQALLSALEGTALLLITIWNLPAMWRNKRRLREKPYLLMAFFYTGGFIVGFSAILNLGLLARQRVQVLPLFFILIAGLAWDETKGGRRKRKQEPDDAEPSSIEDAVDQVTRRGPSRTPLPPVGSSHS
jgi:hypothetical protein